VAYGGAQARFGVTPDLTTIGKIIGGGLPAAAFGGRAEIMQKLAPLGPVYQAGTLSGNPLATAAGLAVLARLDDAAYVTLEATAINLADGLSRAVAGAGLAAQVPQVGPLVGLFFSETPVVDYASAQGADGKRYARFFHEMLDRGVYLPPSPFEALFPSLAHGPAEIESIVTTASDAAMAVAAAG
jgi:glutamate-1-semialdehyde 2,1-aminomutase